MRIETGTPMLLDPDGGGVELRRLGRMDPEVQEQLIQDIVLQNPNVLPVAEIDPHFAPLIPIGAEIPTTAGSMDALFISPEGAITITEAKLWRNPEARREVVGQIIDYATALAEWSYENLDGACKRARGVSLWELVSAADVGAGFDREEEFGDSVSRGLRTGRFLLLVVGDGIREEVERMAAYVQAAPQLQFTLGLVELRIYEHPDGNSKLVVPSVVARTTEVTRAVVTVDVAPDAKVAVNVAVPVDDSPASRRKLTLGQFLHELADHVPEDLVEFIQDVFDEFDQDDRFVLLSRSASVSLRLKDPSGPGEFTVLVFTKDGTAYPGWLQGQCEQRDIPVSIGLGFVADLSAITGIPVHHKNRDTLAKAIPLGTVRSRWNDIRERIYRLVTDIYDTLNRDQTSGP